MLGHSVLVKLKRLIVGSLLPGVGALIFGVVPANAMGTIVVEPGTGAIIYSQNPVPAGSSFRVEFTVSDDAATACCTSPSVRMSNGNGTIVGTYPASMISTTSNYGVVGRTGYVYSSTVSTPSTLSAGQYFIEAYATDSKGALSNYLLVGNVSISVPTTAAVMPTLSSVGPLTAARSRDLTASAVILNADSVSLAVSGPGVSWTSPYVLGPSGDNWVYKTSSSGNFLASLAIPSSAPAGSYVVTWIASNNFGSRAIFPGGTFSLPSTTLTQSIALIAPTSLSISQTANLSTSGSLGTGQISFSSNSPQICTVSGSVLTAIGAGTCLISSTISADAVYSSAIGQATVIISAPIDSTAPVLGVTTSNQPAVSPSTGVAGAPFVALVHVSDNVGVAGVTFRMINPGNVVVANAPANMISGSGTSGEYSVTFATATSGPKSGDLYQIQAQARDTTGNLTGWFTVGVFTVATSQVTQASLSFSWTNALLTPGMQTTLTTLGGSGSGAYTFTSNTPTICSFSPTSGSLSSSTLMALSIGVCTFTVTKVGDTQYLPQSNTVSVNVQAAQVTGVASLGVLPSPVSIGINYPNQIVLNAPYNPGSNNLSGMTLSVRTFTQAGALVSNLPYTGNQVYITGLQPSTNYVVQMVATDSTGATKFSSPLNVTTSPAALQPALTPGINAQSISLVPNGLTVQIANYDSNFSWSVSSTQGSASISNSGLVSVTGATGGTVQVTVTTNRNGYSSGSYTFSSSVGSQQKAPTPVFGSVNSVQGGFATSVSNYDANFTWTPTSSVGNVSGFPVMTVMGLNPGQTSTITVTVSRNGYTSSSASIQGSALTLQGPLVPQFGSPKGTSDGFSISVSNYDSSFDWSLNADSCYASITYSGLIQASGMRPGSTCKISVTSKKSGYQNGQADVTGTTAVLQSPSISMLPGSTGAAVSDRLEVSVAFGKQAGASISSFGIKLQGSSSYSVSSQSYGYSNSYGSFNGSTADYYWSGGHFENGSISIDVSRLSPGTYTLIGYATASESGFNDVSGQGSLTFSVVQAKPQVSITSPSSGSSLKGKIHVTALTSFNVSTSHKIKNVGISISDAIPNFFGSSPYSSLLPATYKVTNYSGTGSIDWVVDTGKLPVGSNTVTVQVEDDQGNIASSTASFNVSRAVPTVLVTSPNEGQSITGALKLSFRAAGDPSSGSGIAFIGLDDPNFVPQFASNQLRSSNQNGFAGYTVWQVSDLGKYDFAEESKNLSDGPKTIHIIVADADGYSASASVNVNVLSTNPTISLSSTSGGSIAPESTFRLSARVAPAQGSGATLSYVGIDDSSASIGFNGTQSSNSDFGLPSTVQLWSVANPSSVSWTLNPAKWNSGPKTINVYAIDSNGHSSVATISYMVLPKATWTLTQTEPAVLGQSVLVGISTSTDIPWDPNSAITVVVQTAPSSNGPWSDVGPLLLDSSGNVGARVVMSDAVTWVRVNHPTPDAVRIGFSAPLQLLSVQSSSEVSAIAQTGTRLANGDGTFPAVSCALVKKSQNISCSTKNVQNVNQPVAMQVQKNGVWVSYRTLKISDLSLIKFSKTGKTLNSYRLVGSPVDSSRKPYIPWVTQVIKSLGN